MHGHLYNYFEKDHRRLDELLKLAESRAPHYDMNAYGQFRNGLLKHIKMEETMLFPALEKSRSGVYTERIAKLRLDHGALTALMVPPPSPAILNALRFILTIHNQREEELEGIYELCDEFVQNPDTVLHTLEMMPDVPVLPHKTEPFIIEATRRALIRAGYNYDDFITA